ncbi:MAG: HEPN domain-containing protein [Anaerolineales bacterium]|nr:HEPN domain-containing protein [Anaerolineales bacterium]
MNENSRLLLEKAQRSIKAAETLLLAGNLLDFATGRAYYAMFYTAEALLEEKELRFSKHGGVHSAFGEHYIKTGLLEPKFHRWLLDAFDQRIEGDYGIEIIAVAGDAEKLIAQAKEFLETAQEYLLSLS